MRVLVAGATGVVGRRVVTALCGNGHQVTGLARTADKAQWLHAAGADAIKASPLDAGAMKTAVAGHDVVINLATCMPPARRFGRRSARAANDRLRADGSRILVDAALSAGAERYVQESVVFAYADHGDEWIDEDWPVKPAPIADSAMAAEAQAARFSGGGGAGVVLRFGSAIHNRRRSTEPRSPGSAARRSPICASTLRPRRFTTGRNLARLNNRQRHQRDRRRQRCPPRVAVLFRVPGLLDPLQHASAWSC